MEQFETISIEQAFIRWQNGIGIFVDIRDSQSFVASHVSGAFHLTNDGLQDFMLQADLDQPIMVMCYHGNSSRGAAKYLLGQGFKAALKLGQNTIRNILYKLPLLLAMTCESQPPSMANEYGMICPFS